MPKTMKLFLSAGASIEDVFARVETGFKVLGSGFGF